MRAQLLVLIGCLLIVAGANWFRRELPKDDLTRAAILHDAEKKQEAAEIFEQMLKKQPADLELNRYYIMCKQGSAKAVEGRLQPLLYDLKTRDRALYLQGFARSMYDDDHAGALERFRRVKNQKLPYLHNSMGYVLQELNRPEQAEAAYRKEIANQTHADVATANLCRLYMQLEEPAKVRGLLQDPVTAPHLSLYQRSWLAWQEQDFGTYCWLMLKEIFETPAVHMASAFLIAVMWLVLLKRLDAFEPEPTWALLVVFGMGCLAVQLLILPLHQFMRGIDPRSSTVQDIYYAVFHVGVVEEIIKLVPVVLFAMISRQINEPVDFLIYGSASALGFATIENAGYFDTYAYSDVMMTRFTLCVVGHITWTSIVCYTWARARHIHRHSIPVSLVATGLALAVAIVWHGLYDNVDSNLKDFLGLLEAVLYGWMLADALNHSPYFADPEKARARLRNDQLIECTALFMLLIPYLWWDLTVSTQLANEWLASAAWSWLLVLTYFVGIEFISLRRNREIWLARPEAGSALAGSVQLLRGLLVLSGFTVLATRAFQLDLSSLVAYLVVTIGVFGVYFRGAYGGLRSPREWWAGPGQHPEGLEADLAAAGLQQGTTPLPASQVRHAYVLASAWLVTGTILVILGHLLSQGGDGLPFAGALMLVVAPLAWARPHFVGAWHNETTWAWIYLRGKRPVVMLWSRLAAGQKVTAAELSPWLVRSREIEYAVHPGLSLAELLERHGTEGQPVRSCEEDFKSYTARVRAAFLAGPVVETLKAFRRVVSEKLPRRRKA